MYYAALYLPRLFLQAALNDPREKTSLDGELEKGPIVVTEEGAKKAIVIELTAAAEGAGIVVGLPIPQAISRCPEVEVKYRRVRAEEMLGDMLFHAAYSLSPRVERQSNAMKLVDLRGVSIEKARCRCEEIRRELRAIGLDVRIGMASSCALATLAAMYSESDEVLILESMDESDEKLSGRSRLSFLKALPIGVSGASEELADILDKWGIRTLAAFAALERSAVGARLGMEGLRLWDRLNGFEKKVIEATDTPPVYEESWEFEYDVDSVEPLLFILRRFLGQLCARLKIAHMEAARVELELELAYGEPYRFMQKIAMPSSDDSALFSLISGRLEGLKTESVVKSLLVRIEPVEFKQRQFGLFESSLKNPHRLEQTLSNLAGIVGAENVGRPELDPSGRPDGFTLESGPFEAQSDGLSLDRHYGMPLRRYRPALSVSVEFQGRQPIWFKSERAVGFVKTCRGPFLHSGHWWEESGNWSRVEWDVELNKGGLYRLVKEGGNWFLEGEYD